MQSSFESPTSASADMLVINLWKNTGGSVVVRSVEILDRVSRVRFSFNADAAIRSVFAAPILGKLLDIIDRASGRHEIVSLPDMIVNLKDLVLKGARIMFTVADDGAEKIMIRFTKYFGRVKSLFRPDFVHRDALADEAVDHAVHALEKVYLPLRNFGRYIDDLLRNFPDALDPSQRAVLVKILGEIGQLSENADLVAHYVNSNAALADNGERINGQREHLIAGTDSAAAPIRRSRIAGANA